MHHVYSRVIKEEGFAIANDFLDPAKVCLAERRLKAMHMFDYLRVQNSTTDLLQVKEVLALVCDPGIVRLLEQACDQEMFAVKAFVLDITMESNWEIGWH